MGAIIVPEPPTLQLAVLMQRLIEIPLPGLDLGADNKPKIKQSLISG